MTDHKLPEAELEVFACLSRLQEATARSIREAMQSYRPMAHGSILTLLKRLEAKGWVSKRKGPVGKAFLYRPERELTPTLRDLVGNLVKRIFGGNSVALVASLFETRPPTTEELAELRQLVESLESQPDRLSSEGES
ncbi:MAG: BlaI/MecI/CopY family transcriptional regulator [Acidobacteriota bacterium]